MAVVCSELLIIVVFSEAISVAVNIPTHALFKRLHVVCLTRICLKIKKPKLSPYHFVFKWRFCTNTWQLKNADY